MRIAIITVARLISVIAHCQIKPGIIGLLDKYKIVIE